MFNGGSMPWNHVTASKRHHSEPLPKEEILDRRDFLRHGLTAAASVAVVTNGLACGGGPVSFHPGPDGWTQLPGILADIIPPVFPANDFNVLHYGAVGDSKTDCKAAFDAAIAACHTAGGGRVIVPSGTYLMDGPIHLLSNVNLHVEAGATIRFSAVPENYLPPVEVRWQGIRCMNYSPFIYAYQQENIAVTGSGTIDGQQQQVWGAWANIQNPDWLQLEQMAQDAVPVSQRLFGTGHYLRPGLFEPYDCKNILVEGVTFQGSAFWTMHPTFCYNVTIQGVTVLPGGLNDDGCDPESCHNVLIKDCSFRTNDDSVSLKAGRHLDVTSSDTCSNIVLQNCKAQSGWSAFTIGSQTDASISNVFIEDCVASDCIAAYYIKTNSAIGGSVENIYIRSSQAITCHHLLLIETGYSGVTGGPYPPHLRNIQMDSMTCQDCSVTAFDIIGDHRAPIEGVYLSNIAIQSTKVLAGIHNVQNLQTANITLDGRVVRV